MILMEADVAVELARACPNLKLVQGTGAGTDQYDIRGLGELPKLESPAEVED